MTLRLKHGIMKRKVIISNNLSWLVEKMNVPYLLALKAQRLEIRFVFKVKIKELPGVVQVLALLVECIRCYKRRYALCSNPPPPDTCYMLVLSSAPLPDACSNNNIDSYMCKCRLIQRYVSLNQEMKNCSNVDQNGSWRTRASLMYSGKKVTFVVAVTALMSRSLVASDRPNVYFHNTFCSTPDACVCTALLLNIIKFSADSSTVFLQH
jgi:hypothetical protein